MKAAIYPKKESKICYFITIDLKLRNHIDFLF